jgi:hypothetical protein
MRQLQENYVPHWVEGLLTVTTIAIQGTDFLVDGRVANQGRTLDGIPLDVLLLNRRMINGAFDDANPATMHMWTCPDTGRWDAERNNREFLAAMPQWKADALDAFTLGIQGGSPQGYSEQQPWDNAGFTADGRLKDDYRRRVGNILSEADQLGLVVVLDLFYHGQDHRLRDEDAIRAGVGEVCEWMLQSGWHNVLIEIAIEVNWDTHYTHQLMKAERVHELIARAKSVTHHGRRLLVGHARRAWPRSGPAPEQTPDPLGNLLRGSGASDAVAYRGRPAAGSTRPPTPSLHTALRAPAPIPCAPLSCSR